MILGRSGGPLPHLAALVRERLGLRCRLVRPDVLQRCSRAHVSPLDRTLAAMAGAAAVNVALEGAPPGGTMIALRSRSDEWETEAVPLAEVRGERSYPPSLRSDAGPLRRLLAWRRLGATGSS